MGSFPFTMHNDGTNKKHVLNVNDNTEKIESQEHKLCVRGHWRPAEDAKLKELVSQHGPQNWNFIADKLEGRSGKSCRLRWFNQLDPRIDKSAFSQEEEGRLMAAHKAYGNKWALIARFFPGRTDNALKNHWHVLMAKRQREKYDACDESDGKAKKRRITGKNNALSSESSVTSNKDESFSVSTYLALTPNMINDHPLKCYGIFQAYPFNYSARPREILIDAERSDSRSEVSDCENSGKEDSKKKRIKMPFFDFLGVGTT